MYIEIDGKQYPCGKPTFGESLTWPNVGGLETPLTKTIITCADDGFIMRKDDPSKWERQVYENDTLTLTNQPEPEPYEPGEEPEPPEPEPTIQDVFEIFEILLGAETEETENE